MLRTLVVLLFALLNSSLLNAATQQQRPPNPDPHLPRSSKICCHENQNPIVNQVDPLLVGVWEVETDWTCGGTEVSHLKSDSDRRRWVLNPDGTCHDSAGNLCTWRAEGGRLLVEFQALDIHFQGTYKDPSRFTGNTFDNSCEKGCLQGVKISDTPTAPSARSPIKDKYGFSRTPSIDMGMVDQPIYIHAQNCPTERAVMLAADGSCMVSGGGASSCRWSSRSGHTEINIGNHRFRGRHNGFGQLNGTMENTKLCGGGCLPPPDFPLAVPPRSPDTQPGTDYRQAQPIGAGGSLPPVIYSPYIPGGGCGSSCASPN